MAVLYVRSTDGNNADSGATWALAKATIAGALAAASNGDTIYVSQAHAEAQGTDITLSAPFALATPVRIICANDGAEPPTATALTGSVATNVSSPDIYITGVAYYFGMIFATVAGGNNNYIYINSGNALSFLRMEKCTFRIAGASTTRFNLGIIGNNNSYKTILSDCTLKCDSTGQGLTIVAADVEWRGGGLESGSSAITNFVAEIGSSARGAICLFDALDLSGGGTSLQLLPSVIGTGSSEGPVRAMFTNCKLPASWSGTLAGSSITSPAYRAEMHNCDSGSTNYRLWVEDYGGRVVSETTVVRSGGASDGTTPLSWKLTSSANAIFPANILTSPDIVIWNETTGSSRTVTVEIVHDTNVAGGQGAGASNAFRNDEIWMEATYLSDSGAPLGSVVKSAPATPLTTPTDNASSSVTWTTTGLTTPQKQSMSVSFTPQKKGYIAVRVKVAKASKTIYVDPKLTIA